MAGREGWKALFKGMSYPLVTTALQVRGCSHSPTPAQQQQQQRRPIAAHCCTWLQRLQCQARACRSVPDQPPLAPAQNATTFHGYGIAKRHLAGDGADIGPGEIFLDGMFAGGACCCLLC